MFAHSSYVLQCKGPSMLSSALSGINPVSSFGKHLGRASGLEISIDRPVGV